MAAVAPRYRPREEEGESVFVSMTDLTVSFLFVILILLAFFATQYKPEQTVSRDEYNILIEQLSDARNAIEWLEEELSAAHGYIDELEKKQHQFQARFVERGRVIAELRMKIRTLRGNLALLRASEIELRERLGELTPDRTPGGSFEDVKAERDAALRRSEALAVEITRLNVAVSDLEGEIARLLERIAELTTPDPLAAYLEAAASARANLLETIGRANSREASWHSRDGRGRRWCDSIPRRRPVCFRAMARPQRQYGRAGSTRGSGRTGRYASVLHGGCPR